MTPPLFSFFAAASSWFHVVGFLIPALRNRSLRYRMNLVSTCHVMPMSFLPYIHFLYAQGVISLNVPFFCHSL